MAWIVPSLSVYVEFAKHSWSDEKEVCVSGYCSPGGCGSGAEKQYDHEVTVGDTSGVPFGPSPWGINSEHAAGGRYASYCNGYWDWS